jgi:hypothetical protein
VGFLPSQAVRLAKSFIPHGTIAAITAVPFIEMGANYRSDKASLRFQGRLFSDLVSVDLEKLRLIWSKMCKSRGLVRH